MTSTHQRIEDIEALRVESHERALLDIASEDLNLRADYLEREGFGKLNSLERILTRDWPEGALVHYSVPTLKGTREFIGHVITHDTYLKSIGVSKSLPEGTQVYLSLDRPVDSASPISRYAVIDRVVDSHNLPAILRAHRIKDLGLEIHRVRAHVAYLHERYQLDIAYQEALLKVLQKESTNPPRG